MNFNKFIVVGNLVENPEIKKVESGKSVCAVMIANNGFKEDDVSFFKVEAWEKKAEFLAEYFKKGSPVLISGRLENKKYKNKDGVQQQISVIKAETIDFIEKKQKNNLE